MVHRKADFRVETRERMRDGNGSVQIEHLWNVERDLKAPTRMFGRLTLNPGCSIGFHRHDGEEEIFYIVSGSAVADDNGTEVTLEAGDTLLTGNGAGHAIRNAGAVRWKSSPSSPNINHDAEQRFDRVRAALRNALFVYDGDLMLERYRELFHFIRCPRLKIHYALKANYNPALLTLLRDAGAGIDAVSPGEVLLAMKLGFAPEALSIPPTI